MQYLKKVLKIVLIISIILIGYFGSLITNFFDGPYYIEQIFWFLIVCCIILLLYLILKLIIIWYKENKKTFNKFEFFSFWFLMVGILFISADALLFAFLKSFVPLNILNSILESENLFGYVLYAFLYISLIIFVIWLILSFFLPKNNQKNTD